MSHVDAVVLGASGQVGEHILRQLSERGYTTIGTFHAHPNKGLTPIDILDSDSVRALIVAACPRWVYLPASLTNVDYCEQYPDVSYRTNVIGIANVVKAIRDTGSKLIYFSSDYIFDGRDGPYQETSMPNPINRYGQHKLIAESYISLHVPNHLIIRTTVVYGWESQGKNFVYRLLNNLRIGKPLPIPTDQIGSPTYAPDLAQATVELTEMDTRGVINVAGKTLISRYGFAVSAAYAFALGVNSIMPVNTEDLAQTAKRPLNAGLVVDKAESLLKRELVDFPTGLRLMAETEPGSNE